MSDLYLRALGPLSVERAGVPVDLGGRQRRLVLAVLLTRVNEVVSVDCLVDALWEGDPPPSYRTQLQGLVSDLRRRLARDVIVTRAPGYLVRISPDRFDVAQFRAAAAAARQALGCGENAIAVRILRAALAQWRGLAFAGEACPMVAHWAAAVDELRATVLEDCIEAQLADGQLAGLSAELLALAVEHPLRERFHGQLMRVYASTGRAAEALAVYRELRRRTVAELGIEPSAELQRLHRRILAADPAIDAAPGGAPDRQAPASAYRQLPPDVADFTGRRAELAELSAPGRVLVVEGMGGVGKTTLVVHAAHRLVAQGRYRDGQLYVDLRGFSPRGAPADPAAVLESFLRLLGVPAARIPVDLEARSAVFRDRLAGQRMLILLDNAADEEQVAPLLPAGPGCRVLVTSRRSLALDGAHSVRLTPFTSEEAVDLLAAVLGADRSAAEPEATRDLVARCGRLPLAVAIAAQRLRARPAWPIAHLVTRLADEHRSLGELARGGRDVETVFAHSYWALEPVWQRLFRLLGGHPGNDFTVASVAALAEMDPADAERGLEYLLDEHLLEQSIVGRYRMHDLLRAYAGRVHLAEDPADDREVATTRLLDWYVHATETATRPIRRFRVHLFGDFPPPKAPDPEVADTAAAMAWLDAEYPNLVAVIGLAAGGPWYRHAVQLAYMLQPYLVMGGRGGEWIATQRLAEAAACRLGDPGAHAHVLTSLGQAYSSDGRTPHALTTLRQGLDMHRQRGDRYGEAVTLNHLGSIYRRLGRHAEGVDSYRAALRLFERLDDRAREASTQSNLSVELHLLDRHEEAIDHAHRALRLQQESGGRGEASIRTNLGLLYARLGRHAEAVHHTLEALALHRREGSVPGEANALANLSYCYARQGLGEDAVRVGLAALDLAVRLADPEIKAGALNTLGEAHRVAGDRPNARRRHAEALAIATEIEDSDEQARAREGLAAAT